MTLYVEGVVTCRHRDRAVEVTLEDRDRLTTGHLPCPACGERCRPSFRRARGTGVYLTWTGDAWQPSDGFDER